MTRDRQEDAPLDARTMLLAPVPAETPLERAARCLKALAGGAPLAAIILPAAEEGTTQGWRERLAEEARVLSVACLLKDDVDACVALSADGVVLHDATPGQVREARARLGGDGIIGVCCPARRHALMELGEAGADWLGVDQRVEAGGENLLAWAVEMFTLPVAAMHPVAPEELPDLRALGADFVVASPAVWESAERAAALAAAYAVRAGA